MSSSFADMLAAAAAANNSLLCVGLDPVPERLPAQVRGDADPVLTFNRALIDATADLVCAYKPNFGFYGALGRGGWDTLAATIEHIPEGIPVIVDAKVGDIGSTAERYAQMFFGELRAHALTVNPYMGADAVSPFLAWAGRGIFLLCLTSNPGADDFEKRAAGDGPLYEQVARKAVEWSADGCCGLVVGATQPEAMAGLRATAPELPFLVPGVGAQGGDLAAAVGRGVRRSGDGVLINASRGVIYASAEDDFATAARREADSLRQQINEHRGG